MSDTKDDGGPAFPSEKLIDVYPAGGFEKVWAGGMSLRDWFAGQALAGMGSWTPMHPKDLERATGTEQIAARVQWAYRHADAMLAASKAGESK